MKNIERLTCESAATLRIGGRVCHRDPRTWPPTSSRSRSRIAERARAEIRGRTTEIGKETF